MTKIRLTIKELEAILKEAKFRNEHASFDGFVEVISYEDYTIIDQPSIYGECLTKTIVRKESIK